MFLGFSLQFKISNFFLFRLPHNWENPISYLVVVTYQYVLAVQCFTFIFCHFSFAIACGLFLIAIITKNVKNNLKSIDESAGADRNRSETVKLIADFIETHSFLKQLSVFCVCAISFHASRIQNEPRLQFYRVTDDFSNIFQITLVVLFMWSLVTISSAMLLIQMQIVQFIIFDLIQ